MMHLKLVEEQLNDGSIPPSISQEMKRVLSEGDITLAAIDLKLEFATIQLRQIIERVERIEKNRYAPCRK